MSLFWSGIIIFSIGAFIRYICRNGKKTYTNKKIYSIGMTIGLIIAIIGMIVNIIGLILNS